MDNNAYECINAIGINVCAAAHNACRDAHNAVEVATSAATKMGQNNLAPNISIAIDVIMQTIINDIVNQKNDKSI